MTTRRERWARIDAAVERVRPVFAVLTDADWGRSLRAARAQRNHVRAQIQQKILDVNVGKTMSGNIGGTP